MLVRYELSPVPRIDTHSEAPALLQRIIDGKLPLFVLQNAGFDEDPTQHVTGLFGAALDQNGYSLDTRATLGSFAGGDRAIREYEGMHTLRGTILDDFGLHVDPSCVEPTLPRTTAINFNYTSLGSSEAHFFNPRTITSSPDAKQAMTTHYAVGLVDDAMVDPQGFGVTLRPNDLIVFRSDGSGALAHNFRTLEAPRHTALMVAYNYPRS